MQSNYTDPSMDESWKQLRMPEPERISFHTARELAVLAAESLDSEIAICVALPGSAEPFQILPLIEAKTDGRTVLEVVSGGPKDAGLFFDFKLKYTSSDQEIVASVLTRLNHNNSMFQMAAMTDLSRIMSYVSFTHIEESPYAEVIRLAAESILSGNNTGVANHASAIFVVCPEATRLYAERFTQFIEEGSHPNYSYGLAEALKIALQRCNNEA